MGENARIEVTALLLGGGFLSTAVGPMGEAPDPWFRVTAASADRGAARPEAHIGLASCALSEVRAPDLIWVPAGGARPLEVLTLAA